MGKIEVHFDYSNRAIEIRDNGVGMSEEVLRRAVNIGGHKYPGGRTIERSEAKVTSLYCYHCLHIIL